MEEILKLSKEDSERNNLLLELLKENWAHGRHVESERLEFTNFYGAIVAGSLALLGDKFDLKSINSISVLVFLLAFSFLGFQLSRKWGNVFDDHMVKVESIAKEMSSHNLEVSKYIEIPKPDGERSFLERCKRTKNLFNCFYIITSSVWVILLIISVYNIFY